MARNYIACTAARYSVICKLWDKVELRAREYYKERKIRRELRALMGSKKVGISSLYN